MSLLLKKTIFFPSNFGYIFCTSLNSFLIFLMFIQYNLVIGISHKHILHAMPVVDKSREIDI